MPALTLQNCIRTACLHLHCMRRRWHEEDQTSAEFVQTRQNDEVESEYERGGQQQLQHQLVDVYVQRDVQPRVPTRICAA